MSIPHIQYAYAMPVGVASMVAFVVSFCAIYFALVPKLQRAQTGRNKSEVQLTILLSDLQSKNTDLHIQLWNLYAKLSYGPLHKQWERTYWDTIRRTEREKQAAIEARNATLLEVKTDKTTIQSAEFTLAALLNQSTRVKA